MTHGEVQQSLAAYALGSLEAAEIAELEEHLHGCAFCSGLATEAQRVAGTLAFAAPYRRPPAGGLQKLLVDISGVQQTPAPKPRIVPPSKKARDVGGWLRLMAGRLAPVPLAASLALVLGLSAWNFALMEHMKQDRGQILQLNSRITRQSELLFMMNSEQTVSRKLQGTDFAPQAQVRLVMDPIGRKAMLMASHLPRLAAGWVYQVWLSHYGSKVPGCRLVMEEQDGGDCTLAVADDLGSYDSAWMTVEPEYGTPMPVSTGVARGSLF